MKLHVHELPKLLSMSSQLRASGVFFLLQVSLGPNLDTIHMLCAAFGDVAKIAMFEKQNALQALVQFKDPRNARDAQQTLNGTTIPDHMVPNHPGKIIMKVSFSAHTDLQIHSQSDRSR